MTDRRLAALALAIAAAVGGCERRQDPPAAPPPVPIGSAAPLPDPLTLDWKNLIYDLGPLGVVRATAGRAALGFLEDDDGALRATQDPQIVAEGAGALVLDPPRHVDLDGDGHDEAVIPFELVLLADMPPTFGVFVFTLRGGAPIQLGKLATPSRDAFAVEPGAIVIEGARWTWDPARGALGTR